MTLKTWTVNITGAPGGTISTSGPQDNGGTTATQAANICTALNAYAPFARYFSATSTGSQITVTSLIPGIAANSFTASFTQNNTGASPLAFTPPSGKLSNGTGAGGFSWGSSAGGQRYFNLPVGNSIVWYYSSGMPTFIVAGRQ